MSFIKKYINILQISIIIINFSVVFNSTNEDCDIYKFCDECSFCGEENDYTQCSYYNIFCTQKMTNYTVINDTCLTNYISFFRNIQNAYEFCGQVTYTFDSLEDSFLIIKKTSKDIKNANINHCNYEIDNNKYFNNYEDTANLVIKFKTTNSEINNLKGIFNIIVENSYSGISKLIKLNEINLLRESYELNLNNYNTISILLDFYVDGEINTNIDDYFEIKIVTDNPSITNKKLKKYIIIIVCIFIVFLVLSIIIALVYRRKKIGEYERRQNEALEQEKLKRKQNEQKIKILFETTIKPKEFNKKYITNDCTECAICIDKFEEKCSICITPCKHVFHYECIKKYIETAKTQEKQVIKCPLCNYDFLKDKNVEEKFNGLTNVVRGINNSIVINEIDDNENNEQYIVSPIRRHVINTSTNARGTTTEQALRNNFV